jgi:hypothetical protein
MLGPPPALIGRFKLDDTRQWKNGDVLTAVESDAIRNIRWVIPLKDGRKFIGTIPTKDFMHCTTQYKANVARLPTREQGNWYQTHQLEGPERPYRIEIKLKFRNKKVQPVTKQPKSVEPPD